MHYFLLSESRTIDQAFCLTIYATIQECNTSEYSDVMLFKRSTNSNHSTASRNHLESAEGVNNFFDPYSSHWHDKVKTQFRSRNCLSGGCIKFKQSCQRREFLESVIICDIDTISFYNA